MRLIGLLLASVACTADLRPEGIRFSDETAASGRAWLRRSAEAHGGLDVLARHRDARIDLTDEWPLAVVRWFAGPWPVTPQRLLLDVRFGTDDTRLRFVDGPWAEQAWGTQQWVTYRVEDTGHFRYDPADAPTATIKFQGPTLAYFVFMPWRMLEATVVADTGEVEIDGRRYRRVFYAWSEAPDPAVDQYLVFIDAETALLRWSTFTIRDLFRGVTTTVSFEDLREVGGLRVPFSYTMVEEAGATELVSHRFRLDSLTLDPGFPDSHYVPKPELSARK